MNFSKHYELNNKHAILSASNYHWINYTSEKLLRYYLTSSAKEIGTKKHSFAAQAIEMGIKISCPENKVLEQYVNDCIDEGNMSPEQPLIYDQLCFGTADAIKCDEENHTLIIYDLKTGTTPASFKQLLIYAALFFLEYEEFDPEDFTVKLRIYQEDNNLNYKDYYPDSTEVYDIMSIIIKACEIISNRKENQ